MPHGTGRSLRLAALGFACNVGFSTAVAIRDGLPGRPFGIRAPLSVPQGILVGWGAGVAAPWPMPVAALMVAARVTNRPADFRPTLVCAGIGVAGIIGLLIEPITYAQSSWSPATRASIALGFLSSAILAVTALCHMKEISGPEPAQPRLSAGASMR